MGTANDNLKRTVTAAAGLIAGLGFAAATVAFTGNDSDATTADGSNGTTILTDGPLDTPRPVVTYVSGSSSDGSGDGTASPTGSNPVAETGGSGDPAGEGTEEDGTTDDGPADPEDGTTDDGPVDPSEAVDPDDDPVDDGADDADPADPADDGTEGGSSVGPAWVIPDWVVDGGLSTEVLDPCVLFPEHCDEPTLPVEVVVELIPDICDLIPDLCDHEDVPTWLVEDIFEELSELPEMCDPLICDDELAKVNDIVDTIGPIAIQAPSWTETMVTTPQFEWLGGLGR